LEHIVKIQNKIIEIKMQSVTESSSNYDNLEQMSVAELLTHINEEDQTVALSVAKALPALTQFVSALEERMKQGGRLFYIGAGTSGRLGIVDASECPPTFGVPHDLVIGIIAGGDTAIRKAVEFAEDDDQQAWIDISAYRPTPLDTVVGIAASGRTPYVIGGVKQARKEGLLTACICCNPDSPLAQVVAHPIVVVVGAEFITGSTRMKAGTAQKLLLNMISTAVMVRLGRVKGNKMVDMQLSNHKLIGRGVKIIQDTLGIDALQAQALLEKYGNVRSAIENATK
jgi:N-acetylmuramic acid 6-phosphate etherase